MCDDKTKITSINHVTPRKWSFIWPKQFPPTNKLRFIKQDTFLWCTLAHVSRREEALLCKLRIVCTNLTHSYLISRKYSFFTMRTLTLFYTYFKIVFCTLLIAQLLDVPPQFLRSYNTMNKLFTSSFLSPSTAYLNSFIPPKCAHISNHIQHERKKK